MQPQTNNLTQRTKRIRPQKHWLAAFNEHGVSKLPTLFFLLIVFVFVSVAAANRQNIVDYLKLRNYSPPAEVAALATETTMNAYGRKIFYVNAPAIDSKSVFKSSCPNNGGEQSIVLGCYHGNQGGIYLLNVSDPRLSGVKEVTAAHEMLHGAYDRLSSVDKTSLNEMLQSYYDTGLKDKRIKDTVDAYRKTEPNDVVNEMHSIFGTEVRNLPAPLEAYYARYFTNRSAVVAFAEKYQSVFSTRQLAVERYDAQLTSLKAGIASQEAALQTRQAAINQSQSDLQQKRASGQVAGYNAGVPAYNALVAQYNADVAALKSAISQFNTIVSARNAVAVEESELASALNTNVETIK
jgi:hypothetical protein